MRRIKILRMTTEALQRLLGISGIEIVEIDAGSLHRTGSVDILLQHDLFDDMPTGSQPVVTTLGGNAVESPYPDSEFMRMLHERLFGERATRPLDPRWSDDQLDRSVPTDRPVRVIDREPDAATAPRRSIQLDEIAAPTEPHEPIVPALPREPDPDVVAMGNGIREDMSEDDMRTLYEDNIQSFFDSLKDHTTYPVGPSLTETDTRSRFTRYVLARLRPTWDDHRNAEFRRAMGLGPAYPMVTAMPHSYFEYPRYRLHPRTEWWQLTNVEDPDEVMQQQPSLGDMLLIYWTSERMGRLISTAASGVEIPRTEVMNRISSRPDVAGLVRCRWCECVSQYNGRSRICQHCTGLL